MSRTLCSFKVMGQSQGHDCKTAAHAGMCYPRTEFRVQMYITYIRCYESPVLDALHQTDISTGKLKDKCSVLDKLIWLCSVALLPSRDIPEKAGL